MSESCHRCDWILGLASLLSFCTLLISPLGSVALYVFMLIFILALCTLLYRGSSRRGPNEQSRVVPQQNVPPHHIQVIREATRPTEHAEVSHDKFYFRSSMGRILVPFGVDEEESNASVGSCRNEADSSTPCADAPVLSADFGYDEILPVKETVCSICLVEYRHGEEIQRNGLLDISGEDATSCDHMFHPKCISTWIESSGKSECPFCRGPFHLTKPPAPSINDID